MKRRGKKRASRAYPPEFRLRAVLMHKDNGLTQAEVARELGMSINTLNTWVLAYNQYGAASALLRAESASPRARGGGGAARSRLPGAVRRKIVELKKENHGWGGRRIAQVMRRWFLMEASPETVRRTLNQEDLIEKTRKKPRRNRSRPRFFERATPNQMWQSDIFTFRLGGRNAYLIAFLDDYSRYIVGAGLYRSQTAEAVIEVFRRATG